MVDEPHDRPESLHAAYERLDGERAHLDRIIRAALVSAPTDDLGRALRAAELATRYTQLAGMFFELEGIAVADASLHPSYIEVISWAKHGAEGEARGWQENERGWRQSIEEAGRRVYRERSRLEALAAEVDLDDLGVTPSVNQSQRVGRVHRLADAIGPEEIAMIDYHVAETERRRAEGEAP